MKAKKLKYNLPKGFQLNNLIIFRCTTPFFYILNSFCFPVSVGPTSRQVNWLNCDMTETLPQIA